VIADINQHIVDRLQRITFGGAPVTIYPYIPGREQGKTVFPSIGMVLHSVFQAPEDARPNCEVITQHGSDITITIQQNMGGGSAAGAGEYDFKPYPTPVELLYEITALATRPGDIMALIEGIFQAFPVGYTPTIDTQKPLFTINKTIDDDDFDQPLFRKAHLMNVQDVWLDRAEIATYASIQVVDFDVEDIDS